MAEQTTTENKDSFFEPSKDIKPLHIGTGTNTNVHPRAGRCRPQNQPQPST